MLVGVKTCTKCEEEYPATLECFYPAKKAKSNLSSWCRKCDRLRVKLYSKHHPRRSEARKAYQKEYHKKYYSTVSGYLRHMFHNINFRCSNLQDRHYKNYGGRGIKNLFESANKFIDYVTDTLQINPCGLQVHRIDNNGHYEKGNIEFVTDDKHRQLHRTEKEIENG